MRLLAMLLLALLTSLGLGAVARADRGESEIRFVHAATGGGAVDLRLDGQPIIFDLPAGQATAYGRTAVGSHTLSVQVPGSGTDEKVLLSQSLTLAADGSYTLVLMEQGGALSAALFEDDRAAGAGGGNGSLRLVNATSDGTALGAVVAEAALTSLLAPGEASDRTLSPVANPTVTVVSGQGQTLLTTPPLPLGNGELYTLVVGGKAGGYQPILLSYPLGSGLSAESKPWPTLSDEQRIGSAATPNEPQRTLPTTGGELRDIIPPLLVLNGVLLALVGTFIAGWLQQRDAV